MVSADLPPSSKDAAGRRTPPHFWVSTAYFAEGFPYSLVNSVVEILFQQMGASLKVIGLTSLYHLPWNLKFLWGPFVDQYETKRAWMVWIEVALSVALVVFALLVGAAGKITLLMVAAVLILALLSATHDIAIDGFYLEGLDEKQQSTYVGFRATFYRIAAITLSGPLLWLIGKSSWFVGLLVVAGMMSLLTIYHALFLPRPERRQAPISELLRKIFSRRLLWVFGGMAVLIALERSVGLLSLSRGVIESVPLLRGLSVSEWAVLGLLVALVSFALMRKRRSSEGDETKERSAYVRSFSSFMDQERALLVLAFVILFRTGESFLVKMRWPFLNQNVGMSLEAYAFVNGTIGIIASFAATLLGGFLIAKWGLRRCIWPFVFAQNLLNLLYMWVALLEGPESISPWVLGSVIAIEHAGAGLGTAVFMVYLMRCCDPNFKAGHMAILTALMSVSFTIAGVLSGFLADAMGFGPYFGLTFVATIPAMLMIPWLPYLDRGRGHTASASATES